MYKELTFTVHFSPTIVGGYCGRRGVNLVKAVMSQVSRLKCSVWFDEEARGATLEMSQLTDGNPNPMVGPDAAYQILLSCRQYSQYQRVTIIPSTIVQRALVIRKKAYLPFQLLTAVDLRLMLSISQVDLIQSDWVYKADMQIRRRSASCT